MPRRSREFRAEEPALALPPQASVEALRRLALDAGIQAACEGATGVVPGSGNPRAAIVVIGEAPGEQEDRQGQPFVGRSGALLDLALTEAGLRREDLWITNAVKCRPVLADRNRAPTVREVKAWLPVLEAELRLVRPRVVVALGAVAAKALAGQTFKITQNRGVWLPDQPWGGGLVVSWHPSFILRQRGAEREARFRELVTDFATAARHA